MMRIFVNGVPVASMPQSGAIDPTTDPVVIGRNVPTPSYAWQGLIDEVELLNRALSPTEILAIVNAGAAGKCRSCAEPSTGLVAWFPGDGDASDISASHNPGTLRGGASFSAGVVAQAFSLNGTDGYVEAPPLPAQDPTTAGSLAAWVYFAQTPGAAGHIMEIIGKGSACRDFDLQADGDNRFRFYIQCGNQVASSTVIQPGVWYHVAGTWDATGLRIYVNGVLENTNGVQNLTREQSNQPLDIGNQPFFGPRLFSGLIDEAQVFNRALSVSEVRSIADAGQAGNCKNVATEFRITSISRLTTGPQAGHVIIQGVAPPNKVLSIQAGSTVATIKGGGGGGGGGLVSPLPDSPVGPHPPTTQPSAIGTTQSDGNGIFQYDDAGAASLTKRFYRIAYR
jgi:hypothetical protein